MLQMRLKGPPLLSKHVWNWTRASDWPHYDIFDITPHGGEGGGVADQAHTPKLKFPIWLSSGPEQCNFILWWKLNFLWKFEPDSTTLGGVLSWIAIWGYSRYMHSQYMYFQLGVYFLRKTLLNSPQVAPTLAHSMVYSPTSAFFGKIWAYLNAPPRRRITGLLEPK